LGWALHGVHRDREALAYARLALGTGARSAAYGYHLGVIERALGQTRAAQTHLGEALAVNPYFSPIDAPAARAALSELRSA
jgi:hypothetical protein